MAGARTRPAPSTRHAARGAPRHLVLSPHLDDAARDLAKSFDRVWGGFGPAPKFPRPSELEFALRYAARGGAVPVGDMALSTLEKMEQGGIYDQLGGGFCRYSVDERWAIPHFEKMLYDNGPLLGLFADAFVLSGNGRYQQVCEETVGWLLREMRAPEGGFYSALDADSEHEEGKFYVWTPEEVKQVLTSEEYAIVAPHYGLDQPANFEGRHWHFILAQPLPEGAGAVLDRARAKLFTEREKRVRPGRDDKVLVSWNALMIKGLARAARVFGRDDWLATARQAVDFIHAEMWKSERLLASYKSGQAKLNAYLDDYAFLLDALLELLQADYRAQDMAFARALADTLLAQFEDPRDGGFFFTSHDHEQLIHRPKPGYDQATPSGNGIAAIALQRLGHLLGEARYLAAAERALKLFYPLLSQQPAGCMSLMVALEEYLAPPELLILRGPAGEIKEWQRALARTYVPHTLALALPNELDRLPGALAKPPSAAVNAWLCQGVKCLPAMSDQSEVLRLCKSEQVG